MKLCLIINEGKLGKGEHTFFYYLFRVKNEQILEHRDIIETILPKNQRKNDKGKFNFK